MGNLAEYKRDPIGMLLRLRSEYGDIVRNRLGPYITHAVAHPEHIRHVLQDNNLNYVRGRFYDRFKLFFGDGLLTTDGELWLSHRRIAQPLFHRRRVETYDKRITTSVQVLLERWSTYARTGREVDVVSESMWFTLSVLGKVIFNVDLSGAADQIGPAVRLGLEAMMPQGNINDFIPLWAPTPLNRRIRAGQAALKECLQHILDNHKKDHVEGEDLITMLLQARHPETNASLSDREVHDEVMTVFLAGHETTGSGLAWALYEISRHPHVLRKLRLELSMMVGDRAPTSADIPNLSYLAMTIQECLRLYPPIWGYTRDALQGDEIGGFAIPAGSSIFVSPYVTHRHPDFWTNPEAFDPERFDPALNEKRPRFAYFPFGGGPRQCIGIHLAVLQMQLAVAMIVQKYDLHAVPGHPIERGALVSLRPVHGIRMTIHPAQSTTGSVADLGQSSSEPSPTTQASQSRCPFHALVR
jgi:cytochrome P450